MRFISSGQLADLLRVPTHRLDYLTRDRQIRPAKSPTGSFMWSYDDVTRAATLLDVPLPSRENFDAVLCGTAPARQS